MYRMFTYTTCLLTWKPERAFIFSRFLQEKYYISTIIMMRACNTCSFCRTGINYFAILFKLYNFFFTHKTHSFFLLVLKFLF